MGRTDFPISGIPEISGNVASLIVIQTQNGNEFNNSEQHDKQ